MNTFGDLVMGLIWTGVVLIVLGVLVVVGLFLWLGGRR